MNLLGIGPLEIFILAIVAILLLRPEDISSIGKKIGRFLNAVTKSDFWRLLRDLRKGAVKVSQDVINESGIEDTLREFDVMPDVNEIRKELDQYGFKPNKSIGKAENIYSEFEALEIKTTGDIRK